MTGTYSRALLTVPPVKFRRIILIRAILISSIVRTANALKLNLMVHRDQDHDEYDAATKYRDTLKPRPIDLLFLCNSDLFLSCVFCLAAESVSISSGWRYRAFDVLSSPADQFPSE